MYQLNKIAAQWHLIADSIKINKASMIVQSLYFNPDDDSIYLDFKLKDEFSNFQDSIIEFKYDGYSEAFRTTGDFYMNVDAYAIFLEEKESDNCTGTVIFHPNNISDYYLYGYKPNHDFYPISEITSSITSLYYREPFAKELNFSNVDFENIKLREGDIYRTDFESDQNKYLYYIKI